MAIIVLDPGHGGTDSGAVGVKGLLEKDINLAIALKTAEFLRQVAIDVRLTRTTDTTLSLAQRSSYANHIGADYFLAIHINAGGGSGFESYTYSKVTDDITVNNNSVIHQKVASYFSSFGLSNRGEKKADFYVLRDTWMPASLIECGFIDDLKDAELLENNSFLNGLSLALAQGVAQMFGYPEPTSETKQISKYFVDVVEGMEVAQPFIDYLFEKGIMKGDGSGHFLPLDGVNRMQLATVVGRVLQLLENKQ